MERDNTAHKLFDISYYAGLASWVFFALFIVGLFSSISLLNVVGLFGAVGCIVASLICEELANRLRGKGKGVLGLFVMIAAAACAIAAVYGYFSSDHNVLGTAVIVLLGLSFVPSVTEFFSTDDEEYTYRPSGGQVVDTGVFEMFGVHLPQEPPPIVQENRQNDDDDIEEKFGVILDSGEREQGVEDEQEGVGDTCECEEVSMPDSPVGESDVSDSDDESVNVDEHSDNEDVSEKETAEADSPSVRDYIGELTVGDVIGMMNREEEGGRHDG